MLWRNYMTTWYPSWARINNVCMGSRPSKSKINIESFSSRLQYDIALLRLNSAIPFGTLVRPACLSPGGRPGAGDKVTVAGFGKKSDTASTDQLRAVSTVLFTYIVYNAVRCGIRISQCQYKIRIMRYLSRLHDVFSIILAGHNECDWRLYLQDLSLLAPEHCLRRICEWNQMCLKLMMNWIEKSIFLRRTMLLPARAIPVDSWEGRTPTTGKYALGFFYIPRMSKTFQSRASIDFILWGWFHWLATSSKLRFQSFYWHPQTEWHFTSSVTSVTVQSH